MSCGEDLHFDAGQNAFVKGDSPCSNRDLLDCNWVSGEGEDDLCWSCDMTEVIPDTFHGENQDLWAESELAKRRVLAALARWGWFRPGTSDRLPVFRMLSEESSEGAHKVVMAHGGGTITINVMEADFLERMERRELLGEKLRTMVGHFRHEIAHFLFDDLSQDPEFLTAFRACMGDERTDYGEALKEYYEMGAPDGWQARHITRYASSHPHEDWAETVTHLLHLTDIIDSAVAAGWLAPDLENADYDSYAETDPDRLIALGSYYAVGVNHINRSIGKSDIYPFVLTPGVRDKLAFVHSWLKKSDRVAAIATSG